MDKSTKTDAEIVEIARHILSFRLQTNPHLITASDLLAIIQHFEGKPNEGDNNS
jgi:hypothetical protein